MDELLLRERKLNEGFRKLATDIIPHEEYLKKGTNVAQKILDYLKRKSRFDIGRVSFAGSSGKKTTIIDSDFDCVAFINNEEPIFDKVLDDFEDCLMLANGYGIQDIRKTKYSVQFQSNGFEFDLLPVPNFAVSTELSGDDLIDLQQRKTLDKIKHNPGKYCYEYSSGVSEAAVRFIKTQDGFVNEMIRICKFWYKSVFIKSPPSGAKTLIELIAVYSAKRYYFKKHSYLRCFARFLNFISNFEYLTIVFEGEYWKFPEHQVPDYIRRKAPLVLEPTNPYNNLAKYWEKDQINLLKGYADETERRLNRMHSLTNINGDFFPPLEILFEPQPKIAPFISAAFNNSNLLVSVTTDVNIYPDMKVRNEKVMKIEGVARDLKVFQTYLSIFVHGFTANSISPTVKPNVKPSPADPKLCADDVKKQTKNFIDKTLGYTSPQTWTPICTPHEDYDVTYTIPADEVSVVISWKYDRF